jgi:NifU-like protein involved in Fe-S cluster formation
MDYGSTVRQHFRSPRGAGAAVPAAVEWVAGAAEDRTLNVWVRFQVELSNGVIGAARFQVYGCPHTIAAASCVAEGLGGRSVEALRAIDAHELLGVVGAPIEKLGKMLLIEDALAGCYEQLERTLIKEERI